MPLFEKKSKGDHVKVYRPAGTPYAGGKGDNPPEAYFKALGAFVDEFGRIPNKEAEVIEIVGCSLWFRASIFELPTP